MSHSDLRSARLHFPALQHFLLFFSLLAGCLTAHAGVVYRWETINGPATTEPVYGRIEVTVDAYRSGSLEYFYESDTPCCDYDPDAPLLTLAFGVGHPSSNEFNGFDHDYRNGPAGADDGKDTDVSLVFGKYLDADISSGGRGAILSAGSSSAYFVSEHNEGCNLEEPDADFCSLLLSGRWVLDRSTVPVPVPGTWALVGLAIAALVRIRPKAPGVHRTEGLA